MNTQKSGNAMFFTLDEIADWISGNGIVEVPAFQRGLVWKAAQIEVLWDSLMRNIPIGTFSLLPMRGNERYSKKGELAAAEKGERFFLLDGQQRANAISLAFQPFPAVGDEEASILWVDLWPDPALEERSRRKTFFYVTTPARPWGYRVEDTNGETNSGNVPVAQWRKVLDDIRWPSDAVKKPSPAELWPVCARLPVPVAVLFNLVHTNERLIATGGAAPWMKHLAASATALGVSDEELENKARNMAELLENQKRYSRVVATVAPDGLVDEGGDGDNSEIALYFTRLNRSGTEPTREDLDYSILKSILPELCKIDECAKRRMHPARLANLAMLAFLSTEENGGWKRGLTRREIFDLKNKPAFSRYVAKELAGDLVSVDEWLLGKNGGEEFGLPPYLRTRLAQKHQNLYRFLLVLAARMREKGSTGNTDFARILIAFSTTLAWFGKDGDYDFASLAGHLDALVDAAGDSGKTRSILGEWMALQIGSGALHVPPTPAYFTQIEQAAGSGEKEAVTAAWSDPTQTGANDIWYWSGEAGRGLVLYACRKYLAKTFGEYDPAVAAWSEDSRPWDYDHIVPQSWVKGTYQGKWHELVAELLNSIGNIAPIPFGANRAKNNAPPGEVALYTDAEKAKDLFVDFGLGGRTPKFVHEYVLPECNQDNAFDFARVTARRLAALYREWWNALEVGALLEACVPTHRKTEIESFAAELRTRFPATAEAVRFVYNAADGTQRPVEEPWDWARPWISCGITGWWQPNGEGKRIHCFLAQTFQEDRFEMGLRRHPDENTLDGRSEWWIESQFRDKGDFHAYVATVLETPSAPDAGGVFFPEA